MEKVTRIGVSLEPKLLEEFDRFIQEKGFATRSEAIRDLVRKVLVQESIKDNEAHAVGTITLLYNHNRGSVKDHLTDVQHHYHGVITSAIHVHLDNEKCLEVLVVHGSLGTVRALHEGLASVKSVLTTEPVLLAGEVTDHRHD
ncbi:MAG TPA: nickel-responsive transcriptional regulator NikR [Methanomassiliicoccales archaeon]|nr:nickel-responsive transcriptional regulator NikR [Methanomassiliicoccales archaeon]